MKRTVSRRPTETVTGIALATAVYGFLTQADVDHTAAAMVALVLSFGPTLISELVDAFRSRP